MGGRDVPQRLEAADLGGHGLGHHRAQEVTKAADGGTEAGGRGDRRTPGGGPRRGVLRARGVA